MSPRKQGKDGRGKDETKDSGKDAKDHVQRARKLLESLMVMAGLERQEIDRRLGVGRGFTSQVLTGRVELKFRHIMDFLVALEVEPATFFRILFPDPDELRRGGTMIDHFLYQMRRTGQQDLILQQPPPAVPGVTADQVREMIVSAIEEAFAGRDKGGGGPRGRKGE